MTKAADGFDAEQNLANVLRERGVPSNEELEAARQAIARMTPSPPSDDEKLIERLRLMSLSICGEAASRLQALVSENARLREFLLLIEAGGWQPGGIIPEAHAAQDKP